MANVVSVERRKLGEFFLRDASLESELTKAFPKD
jgi:hypothetical protein